MPGSSTTPGRSDLAMVRPKRVAVGAFALEGLYAQAKPPVYVVVDISEITDPEAYKAISQVPNASMPLQDGPHQPH
jgi:hypothetical protein